MRHGSVLAGPVKHCLCSAFVCAQEVLYISTHQAGLWPRTGRLQDTGDADGTGATINLPLPGGSGHAAMELVLQQLVAPAALRFQPDLIFVSAGFDAHFQDPLAGLTFTSSTYHLLASRVAQLAAQLCNGRCLFILEGGYHLPSLGASVAETFRGLLGLPLSGQDAEAAARLLARQPEPLAKVQALLDQAKRQHSIP